MIVGGAFRVRLCLAVWCGVSWSGGGEFLFGAGALICGFRNRLGVAGGVENKRAREGVSE